MIAIAETIQRLEKKSATKLLIVSAHFKAAIAQVQGKEGSFTC
jgi:hypothetical protein